MKTFPIKYTEKYTGYFTVEAENEEAALEEFEYLASEGQLDFDDLEMTDSDTEIVSCAN